MTHQQPIGRRTVLRTVGGIAIGSVVTGCMSGASDSSGTGGTGGENGPNSIDDWLSETKNYDGTIRDRPGKKSVTVTVGPKENEYVFAPAAMRVARGTTITWKWIDSGYHNVIATDGQFNSGQPEQNATFEHTFETAGTFYYYCEPHRSMGMKGAVIVSGDDSGSSQ